MNLTPVWFVGERPETVDRTRQTVVAVSVQSLSYVVAILRFNQTTNGTILQGHVGAQEVKALCSESSRRQVRWCVSGRVKVTVSHCMLICRNIESGLYDDQPNTPSKSKIGPRRPLIAYLGMLLIMFLTGMLLVRPEVGIDRQGTRFDTSSSMQNPHRARKIENSEARQREALEIADTLHGALQADALGQLSGGGGTVVNGMNNIDSEDDLEDDGDSIISNEPVNPPEISILTKEVHDAVKEDPSTKQAAIAAAVEKPETITVSQPLVKGGVRDISVEKAKMVFLESLSDGLESEDMEGLKDIPEDKSWWTSDHTMKLTSWDVRRAINRNPPVKPASDEGEFCKIHVLDVNKELGPLIGARNCNLGFRRVWPFARRNWGIDGVDTLPPEHYQYATEYWLSQAIMNSSKYEDDPDKADLIFVDMYCYHMAWLAYIHPLGNRNTTDPEPYMRKALDRIVKSERFVSSKGGDHVFVHPSPIMSGLFKEEAMCEDLASALHLVPERSSLCVWTPNSASQGLALIMPYAATLDLDFETDLENVERDVLLYYRGGCGHPHKSIRGLFAAGKMMRYNLIHSIEMERNASDIDVKCACDICDNHTPHKEVMMGYRRSRFCPILPSNVQSSRRLSEVILSGCIPVFIGPPFHSLPLELDVDYRSMGIFINITNSSWIDDDSPHHLQNKLVSHLWPLDDTTLENDLVLLDNLYEVIDYLRNFPPDEEGRKRRAVLEQRFAFYYGAVPTSAGGDGRSSKLGDIAMRHMCRHAAEEKRKMQLSESQGITGQPNTKSPRSVMKDGSSTVSGIWSLIKGTV